MNVRIREMDVEDWQAVRSIYLEGIATGDATFETTAPSWEHWTASHLPLARLVATASTTGKVVGWGALAPVSTRAVYSGVAEVSLYIATSVRGQGVGKELLECLIRESERNQIWTLQAGIFPENEASISLHKHLGFRLVGKRERIGKLNGRWRDTVLLERRSAVTGVD
jgi:phosphinothricin acetyltransferase